MWIMQTDILYFLMSAPPWLLWLFLIVSVSDIFAFLCIECTSIKCIKIGWQNLYFVWCLCLPTNIYRQNLNKGNKHTCMSTSCFVLYVCLQQLCRHVVLPGLKSVYIYSCEVVCDEFWFWVHFVGAAGIKQCRYSRLAYRLTI